jgi:hypothetical protein
VSDIFGVLAWPVPGQAIRPVGNTVVPIYIVELLPRAYGADPRWP